MTVQMPKVLTILCGAAVAIACIGPLVGQSPDSSPPAAVLVDDDPRVMMGAKLTRSKEVLEGLLRNDFGSISRAAREMKRISEAAEWSRNRDAVYERFGAEFRRQCNQLEELADANNQEGVKFTYLNMTTTCINCHDYVRDSRRMAERRAPEAGTRLAPRPTTPHGRFH